MKTLSMNWEKTYSIGEKGIFPKEFCPYHKIFGQKGPENIYF